MTRYPVRAATARVRGVSRRVGRRIARWDDTTFRRLAAVENTVVDGLTTTLTRLSDHSLLWTLVAATLVAHRRPAAVRAAAHGLLTIAATSAVANQGVKRLWSRGRPPRHLVPAGRRSALKTSSSFPSGHTASAVAFLVVVGRHRPPLIAPLAVGAVAVGLSRVATGLHYASDVLGGAAVGAVVGTVSARWAPHTPAADCAVRPARRCGA